MRHAVSLLSFCLLVLAVAPVFAAEEKRPAASQFELPAWFKASFLDLRDDIATAAGQRKRLMVYVGQDGCPYCRELMQNNFSQPHIVDYTRKHFDVLAINMWGDADVTDIDGAVLSEKAFAVKHGIRYTPTLLFYGEDGKTVLRLNGYYPPHQFLAALQYVAGRHETRQSFRDYFAATNPAPASGKLHPQPWLLSAPLQLSERKGGKPLLVLFEQKDCAGCDYLHQTILAKPETRRLIDRFDVARVELWSNESLVTPDGARRTARDWSRTLGLVYAPSAVLFDASGKEVMRIEGMLKTFHVQSVLDYVASGEYRTQPNFQRYIDARAEALRAQGVTIDLWQ